MEKRGRKKKREEEDPEATWTTSTMDFPVLLGEDLKIVSRWRFAWIGACILMSSERKKEKDPVNRNISWNIIYRDTCADDNGTYVKQWKICDCVEKERLVVSFALKFVDTNKIVK